MTEYRRGQPATADTHRTFKPIGVHVKSTDSNLYGVIAEQHPRINVDAMQIRYITLTKLTVGDNAYLPVQHKATHTNTPKLHITLPVTRYYEGGEVEEEVLIAKVDKETGELDIKVPNDFVIEVTLVTR